MAVGFPRASGRPEHVESAVEVGDEFGHAHGAGGRGRELNGQRHPVKLFADLFNDLRLAGTDHHANLQRTLPEECTTVGGCFQGPDS